MAGSKKKFPNEFMDDDDDKKETSAGYVPKQSLDPKIFLNDASKDVAPGINDDDYCVNCFASPFKSCKCGKPQPGPKRSAKDAGKSKSPKPAKEGKDGKSKDGK